MLLRSSWILLRKSRILSPEAEGRLASGVKNAYKPILNHGSSVNHLVFALDLLLFVMQIISEICVVVMSKSHI